MRGRKMSRRRTRMRSSKSRIKFHRLMGLLIILLSFGGGWLVLDYQTFKTSPLPVAAEGYRHIIEPGTSVTRLAADLRQAGILPHPFYFRWMARWEGRAAMIKAGEYQYAAGNTPTELLDKVESGAVLHLTLSVVEGWRFAHLLESLRLHEAFAQTLCYSSPYEVMIQLGHPWLH